MVHPSLSKATRRAVQAGRFYESDPAILRAQVREMISAGSALLPGRLPPPMAILAPHAGYIYSGRIAGAAYATLHDKPFDRVLVLAPSHYAELTGAALPSHAFFETPLGEVAVDQLGVEALCGQTSFAINDPAHAEEHAVEVQLPFLQVALTHPFQILPMTLGRLPAGGLTPLARSLATLIDERTAAGERWLVLSSSDTYHGYNQVQGVENDQQLVEIIKQMDPEELVEQVRAHQVMACGWMGLALAMMLARHFGATGGFPLVRSDSHNEAGTVSGYVVGYVAATFG